MENKDSKTKFFAGLFFIIGIIIILLGIFTIGKNKGLIQSKFQVTVLYKNVGGLMEGAPVLLAGVNVGNVAIVDFLEHGFNGRQVRVVLNIFSQYRKQIEKSASFAIKTEGILGEKIIEIDILEDAQRINLGQPIIGEDPLDVQDLAEVFTKAAESFTKTSEQLSQINIRELSDVMEESSKSLLVTSEGLNVILNELKYMTIKSKRLLDRVEQRIIDGTLFKVF